MPGLPVAHSISPRCARATRPRNACYGPRDDNGEFSLIGGIGPHDAVSAEKRAGVWREDTRNDRLFR